MATVKRIVDEIWVVNLIESERGWGSKVDEVREFDTEQEALEFVKEFNSHNDKPYVPDWYMYAESPYKKENILSEEEVI